MRINTVNDFMVNVARCIEDRDIESLEKIHEEVRDWIVDQDTRIAINVVIDMADNTISNLMEYGE